jgi:hypothetical protein
MIWRQMVRRFIPNFAGGLVVGRAYNIRGMLWFVGSIGEESMRRGRREAVSASESKRVMI